MPLIQLKDAESLSVERVNPAHVMSLRVWRRDMNEADGTIVTFTYGRDHYYIEPIEAVAALVNAALGGADPLLPLYERLEKDANELLKVWVMDGEAVPRSLESIVETLNALDVAKKGAGK